MSRFPKPHLLVQLNKPLTSSNVLMLKPTVHPITDFQDSFEPRTEYVLQNVRLEIPDERTAVFTGLPEGPEGEHAWVRAWISNEAEGTLAEAEISDAPVGSEVSLKVVLDRDATPELACMRIESEQFETKHTVHVHLG